MVGNFVVMSLRRRVRKKVDYSKFCEEEGESTNNSDGESYIFFVEIVSNQTSFYEQREAPY